MDDIKMICNDSECPCDEICCQECESLLTCINKCDSVKYKEKIYMDEGFFIKDLTDLAEKQDNWLILVAAEAVKSYSEALSVLDQAKKQAEADCARYKEWVNDLQSGMYVNCVYCGHRYGPADKVPVSMADALKQHIEKCPEHPMSKLKAENSALLAELEELRMYKRAYELMCDDTFDDECPYEHSYVDWPECKECPHDCEFHVNRARDLKCWDQYYFGKARADIEEGKA